MTKFVEHKWPGLAKPVYLPDSLPASVQLVHADGWWESVNSTKQTTYTQHWTGVEGSTAQGERDWAQRGGRAEMNSTGSYQIIVDGKEVIIALPFNKAAGHAANNTGNLTSYASEMATGFGYESAFQNAAWVAAAVIVSKDWEADTALLQHWNWLRADGTQKNCPEIIRRKGDWPRFVATVSRRVSEIRAFLRGEGVPVPSPAPGWPYPDPLLIPELDAISKSSGIAPATADGGGAHWFWTGDRYRVIRATKRYRRADRSSESIGRDFKVGDEFDGDWVGTFNGEDWVYTPGGTRVPLKDLKRISDVKGGT